MSLKRLLYSTLLTLLFLTTSGCTPVVDIYCSERLAPPMIEVETVPTEFSVILTESVAQLSAESHPWPDAVTLGLTAAAAKRTASVKVRGVPIPGVGVCARADIHVKLSYSPMVIKIGSEIPQGSCKYNEILSHELKHVGAYEDNLAEVSQKLIEGLHTQFSAGRIYRYPTQAAAEANLNKELLDWLGSYSDTLLAQVEPRQKAIDSEEEYIRLNNTCGGPIQFRRH